MKKIVLLLLLACVALPSAKLIVSTLERNYDDFKISGVTLLDEDGFVSSGAGDYVLALFDSNDGMLSFTRVNLPAQSVVPDACPTAKPMVDEEGNPFKLVVNGSAFPLEKPALDCVWTPHYSSMQVQLSFKDEAKRLALLDDKGRVLAWYAVAFLANACGDGVCSSGEENACLTDCERKAGGVEEGWPFFKTLVLLAGFLALVAGAYLRWLSRGEESEVLEFFEERGLDPSIVFLAIGILLLIFGWWFVA